MTDRENFERWYGRLLESLYGTRDAGIAILMVSLPLLERYVRQKTGIAAKDDLTPAFYDELVKLFPLLDRKTAEGAWRACRNGFLHQASLSLVTRKGAALPEIHLTQDIANAIFQLQRQPTRCSRAVQSTTALR